MRHSRSASVALTTFSLVTRRQWLCGCATFLSAFAVARAATDDQQLPPGVGVAATPPCDPGTKPTPARQPRSPWRANAPLRRRISDQAEPGTALVLTGAVIGLRCGLIAGATVDAWQADGHGVSDATGMRLRGRQLTDAEGRFRIETIVPGAAAGHAPRVHLRVMVPGKATITTAVFLPETVLGAANARDRDYDDLLKMTLVNQTSSQLTTSFNVILDL